MTKAQESEDALRSLHEPKSQPNLEAACQLARNMEDHLLHLNDAHAAILEIARASSIEDRVSSALEVIARDMERSLGAIDQLSTDVRAAHRRERGANQKADPAA